MKELAIEVMSSDDSYMPKNVAVLVGNSENKMKEIKNAIIPRCVTVCVCVCGNVCVCVCV